MKLTQTLRRAVGMAFLGLLCGWLRAQQPAINLALGKAYTMTKPNYALCSDPDDGRQLTDGVHTQGHFWTQKTTVGWSGSNTVTITLDLGEDSPIAGLALSSAGGVADVQWPTGIVVLVSPDGEAWHEVGDLVALAALSGSVPSYGAYATHTYRAADLDTHGRFVRFLAEPGDQYFFCDEIEVHAGSPELLTRPYASAAMTDTPELGRLITFNRLLTGQLAQDLHVSMQELAALPAGRQAALRERAAALAAQVQGLPRLPPPDDFRAVLPLNALHRDIFRFQAAVWRAAGAPALRVWQSHRWDPLGPAQGPAADAPPAALRIVMMRNEVRADVLNLTNAGEQDQRVTLALTGAAADAPAGWLALHEVLTVGTRRFGAVSAALPEVRHSGAGWAIDIPAGMTRQVWLSVNSAALPAGEQQAVLAVQAEAGATVQVPFRLRVYPLRFPPSTTLKLGGWAYTNRVGHGGITAANRDALVQHLRERHVNAPWATAAVLPTGEFDALGNYSKTPDTGPFDAFVALWPGARHYMVFVGVGDWGSMTAGFAGAARGTPLFEAKLSAWIRFWADHVRSLGLAPRQLGLLLVDEPHNQAMYDATVAYTSVIRRVEPEITLWVDPQPAEDQACLPMLRSVDVVVPHRPQWLQSKEWFPALFAGLLREGKELGLYSADGPARSFDPYAYYLLQQWHCFHVGATWAGFWSFGGDSRFSVWNEYAADGRGSYCPLYLDEQGVTAGKWMEAVREGVQDYEYLVLLRDAVAAARSAGTASPAVDGAVALLENACARVLAEAQGRAYRWDRPLDRGVADRVRIEILDALLALGPP
jgi:hypothetical protein